MRKIHINNEQWTYTIGDKFAAIKSPANKRVNVELATIKGISQEKIDAGRSVTFCEACSPPCIIDEQDGLYDKVKQGMVTPAEVKDYILNNPTLWA